MLMSAWAAVLKPRLNDGEVKERWVIVLGQLLGAGGWLDRSLSVSCSVTFSRLSLLMTVVSKSQVKWADQLLQSPLEMWACVKTP